MIVHEPGSRGQRRLRGSGFCVSERRPQLAASHVKDRHVVGSEATVAGGHGAALELGLGNEHPVERIAMVEPEGANGSGMVVGHRLRVRPRYRLGGGGGCRLPSSPTSGHRRGLVGAPLPANDEDQEPHPCCVGSHHRRGTPTHVRARSLTRPEWSPAGPRPLGRVPDAGLRWRRGSGGRSGGIAGVGGDGVRRAGGARPAG